VVLWRGAPFSFPLTAARANWKNRPNAVGTRSIAKMPEIEKWWPIITVARSRGNSSHCAMGGLRRIAVLA
jgi:hypothetical protein